MFCTDDILRLHEQTVAQWHQGPIANPYEGPLHLVCQQHTFNYELWHQEDIARSPDVSDAEIADVKRKIDKLNQQRNDHIEKLDDLLTAWMMETGKPVEIDAPMNSETPGSIVDRLSIMALRIYHLHEQCERPDVDDAHRNSVEAKISRCIQQRADLATTLGELLDDIQAGRKRHQTYRQFKMYNDPTLNPYLYAQPTRKAG